jgi:chromate transporter
VNQVGSLIRVFASLSLLTIGGGIAAFPELKTQTVDVHRWLTASQLDYLYSLGQMAPGPNMMMIAAIGESVARVPGAIVAVAAFLTPTAVLVFVVGRLWVGLKTWSWMDAIQRGLRPVSIGLLLAGCVTFGQGAVADWTSAVIAVVAFAIVLRTRINPAFVVLGGALIGVIAYGRT